MTLKKTDIKATIANVEKALNEDQQIAPSTKAMISLLLVMVDLMMTRLGMNSNNSLPSHKTPAVNAVKLQSVIANPVVNSGVTARR